MQFNMIYTFQYSQLNISYIIIARIYETFHHVGYDDICVSLNVITKILILNQWDFSVKNISCN